ncbi:MAG: ribulokinase [Bryobacterales bacterium]|nr:ribulokinase [Bryobacterales bacterium]
MIVAGVDFGTQSVRVSLFDRARGHLATSSAPIPLERRRSDPDWATQRHADHLDALTQAMQAAIADAAVAGTDIAAMALDTTASSVAPVDAAMQPLDDYYLWCDHRAAAEAAEITAAARAGGLPALDWCGGAYSSEWGFAKLLHWLRHAPEERRARWASAFEHCDLIAATLCGVTSPAAASRSACAAGHKWMWGAAWGGFPPDAFWEAVDPRLRGINARLSGRGVLTSDALAGRLSHEWAARLGLASGIPIPVGGIDAHWDAVGAGIGLGDVVNVIGTSTCIMALSAEARAIPGVSGVAAGSMLPRYAGIEAGLAATGDLFEAIARRAGVGVTELAARLTHYRAGQTGLLRIAWDNGDRTVLANPELGGITLGWNLMHTPEDELMAAIEGTAFHTRIILERMVQHGVPVDRVIQAGGIPAKNAQLNQVYASVLNRPVLVPERDATGLGAALFAFAAAGAFPLVEDAQRALCPGYRVFAPVPSEAAVYEELFAIFSRVYFDLGRQDLLPRLRSLAAATRSTP